MTENRPNDPRLLFARIICVTIIVFAVAAAAIAIGQRLNRPHHPHDFDEQLTRSIVEHHDSIQKWPKKNEREPDPKVQTEQSEKQE